MNEYIEFEKEKKNNSDMHTAKRSNILLKWQMTNIMCVYVCLWLKAFVRALCAFDTVFWTCWNNKNVPYITVSDFLPLFTHWKTCFESKTELIMTSPALPMIFCIVLNKCLRWLVLLWTVFCMRALHYYDFFLRCFASFSPSLCRNTNKKTHELNE